MQNLRSGEENANKMMDSQVSIYYSAAANYSSTQAISVNDNKPDASTIEEAESSLQESDSLNNEVDSLTISVSNIKGLRRNKKVYRDSCLYDVRRNEDETYNMYIDKGEARAVLGRYEYQKGNMESALQVFEGIDIFASTPKIKISLNKIIKPQRHSNFYAAPPFSINTVGLLLEAAYLKSKILKNFGRYKEAAESCKVILDVIESSLPEGLPENLGADHKLQETLTNAVILLPYLYQLANLHQEAIVSFRQALLHHWNLNKETTVKIQKEFALFLLYSGAEEANRTNKQVQMDDSFVPENNVEEAILLLMILIKEACLKKIEWDPSILDHLSFALSIYGGLGCLSKQLEELLPGVIENNEMNLVLALCYYGQGDDLTALNLLKNIYENDNRNCGMALLLVSKIYGENFISMEGVNAAKKAIQVLNHKCEEMVGVGYSFLGVSLSKYSKSEMTDFERVSFQREALESLEKAGRLTKMVDSRILYELSLENAEQRKLEAAFGYVNRLIDLEGGSHVNGWMLLARILSAQKRFADGESVINVALDQTEKWDQGELLRTKAKLQLAQGRVKCATQTYSQILAIIRVQCRSYESPKKHLEFGENRHKRLEVEIWNDLAKIYISLSEWQDAEECMLKSKAITNYSASTRHTFGLLYETKGLYKQALKAYKHALDADPAHVQSLVSIAVLFRKLGGQSGAVSRSFLNETLRVDRMNSSAWYNLGLFLRDEGPMCLREAADCFQAAGVLKETEPIEPFS